MPRIESNLAHRTVVETNDDTADPFGDAAETISVALDGVESIIDLNDKKNATNSGRTID